MLLQNTFHQVTTHYPHFTKLLISTAPSIPYFIRKTIIFFTKFCRYYLSTTTISTFSDYIVPRTPFTPPSPIYAWSTLNIRRISIKFFTVLSICWPAECILLAYTFLLYRKKKTKSSYTLHPNVYAFVFDNSNNFMFSTLY